MKNGLIVWNVVLTLIAGYLLFTHLGGKKTSTSGNGSAKNDTSSVHTDFRLAYFEMDSVEENFAMVKDIKSELTRKEDAITNELDKLGKDMQQKFNYYQNQAQSGLMNQAQQASAEQELKAMEEKLKSRKQALDQEYSNYAMTKMKDIKTKIEDFVREYNSSKNYSYIVAEEPGFFYFKDSTYNITKEVIDGLNNRYKATSKKD
jgi:outer membrane protein